MKKVILLLPLILFPFSAALDLDACGPFFPEAIFVYTLHPDFPLDSYAAGHLGILQPTYARSYLYVAYRYLAGAGFDEVEQLDLTQLWDDRMSSMPVDSTAPAQAWLDARAELQELPESPAIDSYKAIDWQSYPNCTSDAFESAAVTLKDRVRKFGADNPSVRDWVLAQDQVFANCAGEEATIPHEPAASVPAILRADRQYQIAAAYFYSGDYPEARKRFQQIAADAASPWKKIAPYLAVRTLVREGTVGAGLDQPSNPEPLRQAEQQLLKMRDDPAAERLLAYVEIRIDPAARAHQLAPILLKQENDNLYRDLWDYTTALDKLPAEGPHQDELTEWLFAFQSDKPESFDASLKRWKQTSAVPWLVAAISKAPPSSPSAAELIAAAESIKKESPAYFTLAYHTIRLMLESGKKDAARQKLDLLLNASRSEVLPASLNRFLAQRMTLATGLDDFLKYAQRAPAAAGVDYGGLEMTEEDHTRPVLPAILLMDDDGASVINTRLPLEMMDQAAHSSLLDGALKKRLLKAVWVRAVLLDRTDVAVKLLPEMQSLAPDAAPLWKAIALESDPHAAKFDAVYLLLKHPGLEPILRSGLERETPIDETDLYRDNWWCAVAAEQGPPPSFLDAAATTAASAELSILAAEGPAPNFLAAEVIRWARAHGDDPRVPEALHLSVKATRFGCTDDATTKFSKEAFQILHRNYPGSKWARKTPYYY